MKVVYELIGFGRPREFSGLYEVGHIAMLNMEARRHSSRASVRVVELLHT